MKRIYFNHSSIKIEEVIDGLMIKSNLYETKVYTERNDIIIEVNYEDSFEDILKRYLIQKQNINEIKKNHSKIDEKFIIKKYDLDNTYLQHAKVFQKEIKKHIPSINTNKSKITIKEYKKLFLERFEEFEEEEEYIQFSENEEDDDVILKYITENETLENVIKRLKKEEIEIESSKLVLLDSTEYEKILLKKTDIKKYNDMIINKINVEFNIDNEDIKELILKNKNSFIEEVINRDENQVELENMNSISVKILYYGDLSIYIRSKNGESIICSSRDNYFDLKRIIGNKDSEKIMNLIKKEKNILKRKEQTEYFKKNPFNKINSITLEGEGIEEKQTVPNLKELNKLYKKYFKYNYPKESHNKTYLVINMENKYSEKLILEIRVDVGNSVGDYKTSFNIYDYIINDLKYNSKTPRHSPNGFSFYIDFSKEMKKLNLNQDKKKNNI
jgi:hypothetical protein